MWRNFSTWQSVIWKIFSTWQIFSPQPPVVMRVTNIRYEIKMNIAGSTVLLERLLMGSALVSGHWCLGAANYRYPMPNLPMQSPILLRNSSKPTVHNQQRHIGALCVWWSRQSAIEQQKDMLCNTITKHGRYNCNSSGGEDFIKELQASIKPFQKESMKIHLFL